MFWLMIGCHWLIILQRLLDHYRISYGTVRDALELKADWSYLNVDAGNGFHGDGLKQRVLVFDVGRRRCRRHVGRARRHSTRRRDRPRSAGKPVHDVRRDFVGQVGRESAEVVLDFVAGDSERVSHRVLHLGPLAALGPVKRFRR